VSFSQSSPEIAAYDFVEVTTQVAPPHARNPFTDAALRGTFRTAAGDRSWAIGLLRRRGRQRLPDPLHAVGAG